jgi:uncharacterized protein
VSRYHMMSHTERELQEPGQIEEIIRNGKYMVLAMCADDRPYAVTLSYGYDRERRCFYFHCAQEGRKLDILRKQPAVCATIIADYGYRQTECSHKYRSLIIWGRLSLVEALPEKRHGFDVLFRQLEGEPDEVRGNFIKGEAAYRTTGILKLAVDGIDAKGNI